LIRPDTNLRSTLDAGRRPPGARSTQVSSRFDFARDTFVFANETVWIYGTDPATGSQVAKKKTDAPAYALRCYVLARSARQFFVHARFDPALPPVDTGTYASRIREVISRPVDRVSAAGQRVLFPGYEGLRSFSTAHESLLKAHCGGAWQSYVQRGNWRMILPFTRAHQAREARRLALDLHAGGPCVIHAGRFPQLTINHALLLYGAGRTDAGLAFDAYDPNLPEHAVALSYDDATRTFCLPPLHYFGGGRVDVYEIYRGWIY